MSIEFPMIAIHKDIVLKLYNWMDYPKNKAARNVEAFDLKGNKLWVIESLGGDANIDCYTHIASSKGTIHAFNFQCFDCVIDESTGKVLSKKFTK